MSSLFQGTAQQRLFKVAILSSAIHAACSFAASDSTSNEPVLTVTAPKQQAGNKTTITAQELQKRGANDFGSIMRYEPLISATGSSGGSSAGKSGFDRAGYTGYNIRGLESNRVGMDIDGIPIPDATGRPYVSRTGNNTFGIGRDYIDPYMFGSVDIEKGATAVDQPNTSIGGNVSFHNKSADDYLSSDKNTYFGYQSGYDSSNRSWHNGITAASGDDELRGLFVYSRRDGQETENNSGVIDAYPANWHSDAFMTSGIWQPNDQHKLSATFDYYHKTNHSHYDTWDTSGNTVWGTAQQQSDTRRWGINLADEWTPYNDFIDTLTTRLYWQQTQAHDNTYLPTSASQYGFVYSDFNVDTYGFDTRGTKTLGRHELSAGVNARLDNSERPFRQEPTPSTFSAITQPQSDSRTFAVAGYLQDKINFDLDSHNFAVIPGVRVMYQSTKPKDLGDLTNGSTVLTEEQVDALYGKTNSDTQVLPSLTFQYDLTPALTTYLQYKRGVQFPTTSQLYGSWNLGSSYAGSAQYALIGNTDLKTETSNNFEWGLKGQATEGVTVNTSVFYNQYKNFIAYTRYRRSANPEMFVNVPSNIYTSYQAENRDKAYIYGAEISTKVNYGTWFPQVDGLSSTFALGYNEGKSKSSYAGDKYIDLDSVAPLKAIVGLAWDDKARGYGAALTATFVKGKQATATNRESYTNTGTAITDSTSEYMRVPGYGMVDATAYWQATKNVKLSGGIYNITDRKYWDYTSSRTLTSSNAQERNDINLAVMPGRTFQLGVNVDF
ncbi:hemoglobin/transferrin/lactoferrin receptor protein [Candidatus Pantoea symbiotica]|jgi:hemoglobin/transferrin/lactoferrin receptor protein|uniref:Hemoglobin/transferrin/lactoferrin receptor protein n=1 Tax=Candidatus Pantoea symbiotica TaxID=1884370 RepID=A0A1I3VFF5_9GAMM|nr:MULTISPECIES: TonB-dependent receptor [Pantoea]KAJ9431911.1 TonB-dependent receptor [Pantoea sp. YR343]MRT24317.1 TonB-dependent receptor [Enterobacteriaceae bacterium RIT697]SFJ93880.1 hemoglobin/transferrin/lactoferrin receptor protein [Pantoea symbiotica]SFU65069.1 hemoglobin/transferrin/lactoferrin receptor protein [Pantoea sp. YR525]